MKKYLRKSLPQKEKDRTMLVIHHPVLVSEIRTKNGLAGYKVEPWLKTTKEDMFIINMDNILTLSESNDIEMIMMHQNFVRDSAGEMLNGRKLKIK